MVVMLFVLVAFGQKMRKENVPAVVRSAFQQKYPAAKNIKWDKEGEYYEASFDLHKKDYSVLMDAQGNIVETEIEIKILQLPKAIFDYIEKHYGDKKVREVAIITDAKGIITYEVEIDGVDFIFDSNGEYISGLK